MFKKLAIIGIGAALIGGDGLDTIGSTIGYQADRVAHTVSTARPAWEYRHVPAGAPGIAGISGNVIVAADEIKGGIADVLHAVADAVENPVASNRDPLAAIRTE